MRILTAAIALLVSSALVPSFAEEAQSPAINKTQMTPVQPERSPQQAEQSRQQDLKSAEDVQVGQDWKAHTTGQPDSGSNQTTTGASSTAHEGGKAGGVSVGEQEKKPMTSPATSEPDAKPVRER